MCAYTRATKLAVRSLFFATFFGVDKFALLIFVSFQVSDVSCTNVYKIFYHYIQNILSLYIYAKERFNL